MIRDLRIIIQQFRDEAVEYVDIIRGLKEQIREMKEDMDFLNKQKLFLKQKADRNLQETKILYRKIFEI